MVMLRNTKHLLINLLLLQLINQFQLHLIIQLLLINPPLLTSLYHNPLITQHLPPYINPHQFTGQHLLTNLNLPLKPP